VKGRAQFIVRLLVLKGFIEISNILGLAWGRQFHCIFQGACHHVPYRKDSIYTTTNDELRGIINTENVIAMTDSAFSHNCEIISIVGARPHHQLSAPATSNQPEFTH
jgi:hypothetical protein